MPVRSKTHIQTAPKAQPRTKLLKSTKNTRATNLLKNIWKKTELFIQVLPTKKTAVCSLAKGDLQGDSDGGIQLAHHQRAIDARYLQRKCSFAAVFFSFARGFLRFFCLRCCWAFYGMYPFPVLGCFFLSTRVLFFKAKLLF